MSNIKLKLQLIGTENQNTNVISDSISITSQTEETDLSEISRVFKKTVADSVVDEEILDGVAADGMAMLFTDRQISIKINDSSDSIILKPIAAGVKTPVFLLRGSITSIKVSNSSGADVNLDVTRIKV